MEKKHPENLVVVMVNNLISKVFDKVVNETGSANVYLIASGCGFVEPVFATTINFNPPNTSQCFQMNLGMSTSTHTSGAIHEFQQIGSRLIQTPDAKKVENWLYYQEMVGHIVICGSSYVNGQYEKYYTRKMDF